MYNIQESGLFLICFHQSTKYGLKIQLRPYLYDQFIKTFYQHTSTESISFRYLALQRIKCGEQLTQRKTIVEQMNKLISSRIKEKQERKSQLNATSQFSLLKQKRMLASRLWLSNTGTLPSQGKLQVLLIYCQRGPPM